MTRLGLTLSVLCVAVAGAVALAQAPAAAPSEAPAAPSTPDAARRDQVLAAFEGYQLTVGALEDVIAAKPAFARKPLVAVEGRRGLMREIVDYELLVREAERRGYAKHLAVRDAVAQRAVERLQAQLTADVAPDKLTTAELEAHYHANRNLYATPPMRRLGYLWFDTREEAERARQRVAQMPLDEFRRFAAAEARRHAGGELGYVDAQGRHAGELQAPPERTVLTMVAFGLAKLGDTVEAPVEHEGRWLVARLTAVKPGAGQALADVEALVREHLAAQRYQKALDDLVMQLRAATPPVVHGELSDAVHLEPGTPSDIPAGASAAPRDPTAPPIEVEPDGA